MFVIKRETTPLRFVHREPLFDLLYYEQSKNICVLFHNIIPKVWQIHILDSVNEQWKSEEIDNRKSKEIATFVSKNLHLLISQDKGVSSLYKAMAKGIYIG